MFAQLFKAKIFSRINICYIFHKLKIKEIFKKQIAFITKFNLYK